MTAPKLSSLLVDPSGLCETPDGKIARAAIGSREDKYSLWHNTPLRRIAWLDDASASAAVDSIGTAVESDLLDRQHAAEMVRAIADSGVRDIPDNQCDVTFVTLPAWAAPLLGKSRYNALSGGRASAKSWAIARVLVLDACAAPARILCLREYQSSISASSKRLLADQIRGLGLASYFEILANEIRCPFDGTINFYGLASDPDKVRSAEGLTHAWLEEAHNLTATGLEVLRPTLRRSGVRAFVSWNPHTKDAPVEIFRDPDKAPAGTTPISANYSDNPWLDPAVYAEIDGDKRDPDAFEHIWRGGFKTKSSARVFRDVEEVDLDHLTADLAPMYSLDLGFNDPCAGLESFIIQPPDKRERPILYISKEAYASGVPVDQRIAFVAGSDPRGELGEPPRWANPRGYAGIMYDHRAPISLDSAEPATIDLFKRAGLRAFGAKKGPGSVALGVERIQRYRLVVHPRCENALRELRLFSFEVDPKTGQVLDDFDHTHSHTPDSLRYAVDGLVRRRFPSRRLRSADPCERGGGIDATFGPKIVTGASASDLYGVRPLLTARRISK